MPSRLWRDKMPAVHAGPGTRPCQLRFDHLVHAHSNTATPARISDFTAFLYEGNLIEFGTTNEIFTRPKQKQTDDYITGRFG